MFELFANTKDHWSLQQQWIDWMENNELHKDKLDKGTDLQCANDIIYPYACTIILYIKYTRYR